LTRSAEQARAAPDARQADTAHAAKSGAMQVVTVAAQALTSATHVLLARLYGPVVFGSYQACLAVLEVVTRGGTGGADKGMLRYIAGHRARGEAHLVQRALGTGLRLALGVGGVAALMVIVFAGRIADLWKAPQIAIGLRCLAPVTVLTGSMWVLVQASLAAKTTRANFLVRGLAEPILLLVAGLAAAMVGRTLVYLALGHLIAAALTLALAIVVVGRVFGQGELGRALKAPRLPGFTRFAAPLGLSELTNAILQRADILLLTVFVGPRATAVYAAAEFVTRVIANARYVLDSVAAPMFSEAIHLHDRQRLHDNLRMMSRWVCLAAAPIAATAIAVRRDLLALYGPSFAQGATALVVLAIGHLVNACLGLSGWILTVSGRSRTLLADNLVAAVLNVTMGLLLIPRFGLIGTTLAALSSVTLLNLIIIVQVWRSQAVHPFSPALGKPIVAAALALAVELTIAHHVGATAPRIAAMVLAGLASYLGLCFALGLGPEERRLVAQLVTHVRWRSPN
jgi:O-antigen/teichoic acid export membrane protein